MNAFKEAQLPQLKVAKLEANADFYWDKFYKIHADRFFNDRHWFTAEFPALLTAGAVLEVGCGVGNTIFPLLEINPTAHVYACDFAATAINIVHQHPVYESSKRVTAFVADLTSDDLLQHVPRGIVDACTMIFVLSAISPEAMPAAVANVKQTLLRGNSGRGGGQILFRDYAAGDLAQERLQRDTKQQRIGEGFYMRGDGTRAYYFTENFVLELFQQQGFQCDGLEVKERLKVNRNTGEEMRRRFIHGVFTLINEENCEEKEESKEKGGEHEAWAPFNSCKENDTTTTAAADAVEQDIPIESMDIEYNEDDGLEIVELGNNLMTLCFEKYFEEEDKHVGEEENENLIDLKKSITNGVLKFSSSSKVLGELVLRCPGLFHDISVVQVRCGGTSGSGGGGGLLPVFAALRWCRRALGVDQRRDALEVFRKNAIRNGWQVAYEKLRVAIEPPPKLNEKKEDGEEESWAAAAFQGPINAVLACIENRDSLIILKQVLSSASRALQRGHGGFMLLVGPKDKLSVANGDGNGQQDGTAVEFIAQAGFEVCELPPELEKAMEGVDVAENRVMFLKYK